MLNKNLTLLHKAHQTEPNNLLSDQIHFQSDNIFYTLTALPTKKNQLTTPSHIVAYRFTSS